MGRRLISVGPRLISNETSTPLSILAEGLREGMTLAVGAPISTRLPLVVAEDGRHAWTRLPGGASCGFPPECVVEVTIDGLEGRAQLRLIDDTSFPELTSLAVTPDAKLAFVASRTTDTVFRVELDSGRVSAHEVGDGPTALALWTDGAKDWLVVAHAHEPALVLIDVASPELRRRVDAPANASGLVVARGHAFVAEQARDTVSAIELSSGREVWRTPVSPNPRELQVEGTRVWVGSLATGAIEVLDAARGTPLATHEPSSGMPIIGGGTAKYSAEIMNGKAPRSLAWSPSLGVTFVASIGPNIGPNADKLEVSMNGGVGVVSAERGWLRHVGFGAGVTEALALDERRGLLYATDVGLGLVRVLDAKRLATGRAAERALLQEIALRPPDGFPRIRPAEDFNVRGRAGPSLHAGPRAVWLSPSGALLVVLERFTGTLSLIDTTRPGRAEWRKQLPITDVLRQRTRRLGQVLYFADLGRTAMSCDACHLEGHGEGVLFEKTSPLRIYRSTTVRGSRETPPYFTPASTRSMGETARVVGGRNRFHNPDPSDEEVEALTLFASLLPTPPNPFVGHDGAPPAELRLPDGRVGHPRRGLALFEGKAGCASCHPAPLYTLDQDPQTRGRFLDVGTPRFMPLRAPLQDTRFEGFGTPSLVGSWDVFPMLTTGLAGLEVRADGSVRVNERFALRVAVERWAPTHGRADLLTAEERDDLLAFVMSL